jgi:hypothetical protein
MLRTSRDPIESGDNDHLKSLSPRILQHRVEAGTSSLASGDANVGVLARDLIPALYSELPQVIELVVYALV